MTTTSVEQLVSLFTDCAVAWGYCYSSGKIKHAEPFADDLSEIHTALREATAGSDQPLIELMYATEHPWVKHCSAAILLKNSPENAVLVLEQLSSQTGLWATMSEACLGVWRQKQK